MTVEQQTAGQQPAGDVAEQFDSGQWEFTPEVAGQFDQHVRQSVPFYDAIQDAVAECADWLAPEGSTIADLGASTGTTALAIINRQPGRARRLHLYDESPDMLDQAFAKLHTADSDIAYWPQSITQPLMHTNASLTLALFTLQFLTAQERLNVLYRARRVAAPDGAILIAEKVRATDSRWAEIATEVSWDRKAERGIPAAAIRAKARALRGVLRAQTEAANLSELEGAGWVAGTVLFRWHQWSLYGAFAG
jgi:tRNA (cmo5U34)-methyltransferase